MPNKAPVIQSTCVISFENVLMSAGLAKVREEVQVPRIIGLDPGSQRTGVGVVEYNSLDPAAVKVLYCEVIDLTCAETLPGRLALLMRKLSELFTQFQPEQLAIENVFMGKNAASAFVLGQARGVCMSVAGQFEVSVAEYAPRSIKKMLTGNGAATKEQVQQYLRLMFSIQQHSLDACDALALAICHAQDQQIRQRLQAMEQL